MISQALAVESVLTRNRESGLTPGDVDDFRRYLCSRARLVQIYFRWRPMLPDPDDDRILELAVRSGSPIVTFNARDSAGRLLAMMGHQKSMSINIIPEELFRRATGVAAAENIPVDDLFASAFEERLLELNGSKRRVLAVATRFMRVMSKVRTVEPSERSAFMFPGLFRDLGGAKKIS